MQQQLSSFYKQWVLANSIVEGVGLSTTFLFGYLIASFEIPGSAINIVGIVFLVVAMGTFLEGFVLGVAQSIPLRSIAPQIGWLGCP